MDTHENIISLAVFNVTDVTTSIYVYTDYVGCTFSSAVKGPCGVTHIIGVMVVSRCTTSTDLVYT